MPWTEETDPVTETLPIINLELKLPSNYFDWQFWGGVALADFAILAFLTNAHENISQSHAVQY